MIDRLWNDIVAWWATVPPDFAFLLTLPFVVAALGIGADVWRRRRQRVADAQAGDRLRASRPPRARDAAARAERRHHPV